MTTRSDRFSGLRILIVEDNDDARELLAMAFSMHGAIVFAASNGAAAISLLTAERPSIVLTDLAMPAMDGYAVLDACRAILPGVPCVAVTAFALDGDREAAMDAGFDAHVSKPVEYATLLGVVELLLREDAPKSGDVRHDGSGVQRTPRRFRSAG